MRVIATADTHGNLPEVPDCDLLIHAGDICPDFPSNDYGPYSSRVRGGRAVFRQANWLDSIFRDWLEKLRERDIMVVGIAGNHDFVFEHRFLIPDLPWIYLLDDEIEVGGLRLYGTPWVPNLPRWAFYQDDEALGHRADAIPDGLDILISHGPPYGVADFVSPQFGSTHVGDRPLARRLLMMDQPPKVVVCGHIHEGYGVHRIGDTTLYSVSHMDEAYDKRRPPVTIWEVEA